MEEQKKPMPMYFSSLEVENVKSFGEKQILDLKNIDGSISPWTLILGDNGVGKTTLLHCLAWMIPVGDSKKTDEFRDNTNEEYNVEYDDKNKIALKPYMDELDELNFEKLIRIGDNVKTIITASLENVILKKSSSSDKSIVSVSMQFEKKKGELTEIVPKYHVGEVNSFDKKEFERQKAKSKEIVFKYDELNSFDSPKIFAYSANRHVAYKNIDSPELKDPIYNLFSQSGELYDAEQVLSMLDTASIRQGGKGKATDLLSKIKEILVDLLPDIKNPESIIINSPINDDGSINKNIVEVLTEDGKVPLFNLSLGYVTMLTWIVDLAIHMLWSFPESIEPLKEPAIVLVDEIDLHLHPVWQRKIMQKLTHHFSHTQFICTAHSPIMAQASENQNLAVVKRIEDKEVVIENAPHIVKGWRIGQLLTSELFDFESERGPELDEIVQERRNLLKKESLEPKEKIELERLNAKIDELPFGEDKQDEAMKLLQNFSKKLDILKSKGDDKNS